MASRIESSDTFLYYNILLNTTKGIGVKKCTSKYILCNIDITLLRQEVNQLYKVLLVDDEKIIIDSISQLIDWEKYNLELTGTAQNGLEAYDLIKLHRPHIVITDIKMPGMSGLDLIKKVNEELPNTIFVILSGYGEFDFASKAIEYGVKHYLLKPCDEDEIDPVLVKIVDEIKNQERKELFFLETKKSLEKVLPQVKEQFLRDCIISKTYNAKDFDFFQNLFQISCDNFKLVLFKPERECDYIEKFALKKISEEIMIENDVNVHLSTVIEENALLLINSLDNTFLNEVLEKIKTCFYNYYRINLTIAISNTNSFNKIHRMYIETQECMQYAFYLGIGSIVSREDILLHESGNYSLDFNFNRIAMSVRTGNMESAKKELGIFFEKIRSDKMDTVLAKSYCSELYQVIIRQCRQEELGKYMKKITKIQDMETLDQIYEFMKEVTVKITQYHFVNNTRKYSSVVEKMIDCVNSNIHNPNLSLTWIAKELLFMNENYLGRLFSKETNEKFSQYVMRIRIEKAKEILNSQTNYKIYEICNQIGFSDPQYFSQVFKKYTGFTPSDYKKQTVC